MIKRIFAAMLVGLLVSTGVAAAPAQAVPYCPADTLCLYQHANYSGTRWQVHKSLFQQTACVKLSVIGADNQASSYYSRLPIRSNLMDLADCSSGGQGYIRVVPGQTASHLGTVFNDQISAVSSGLYS